MKIWKCQASSYYISENRFLLKYLPVSFDTIEFPRINIYSVFIESASFEITVSKQSSFSLHSVTEGLNPF